MTNRSRDYLSVLQYPFSNRRRADLGLWQNWSQQRAFNAAGNVAHIRSILSEYSPKTRVASENRAFASSVAFVPESAAERNARSHSRCTLHDICQVQTKQMNMEWRFTFSAPHHHAKALEALLERLVGI